MLFHALTYRWNGSPAPMPSMQSRKGAMQSRKGAMQSHKGAMQSRKGAMQSRKDADAQDEPLSRCWFADSLVNERHCHLTRLPTSQTSDTSQRNTYSIIDFFGFFAFIFPQVMSAARHAI